MYYSVNVLASSNVIDAYGQYAHQEDEYTLSPSISLTGFSFGVTPANVFSIHPNTHAQVYR